MRGFLLGLLTGILILPIIAWISVKAGYVPVATASPMLPLERQITSAALNARMAKEAPSGAPIGPTEENLMAGARIYRDECAVCHGLRDGVKSNIAQGMFPKPPLLMHGKGVTDDPPGESWWKVRNGIRLTGMPGFTGQLTDTQMWQVSLLVANADKLPAGATAILETK